MPLPRRPAGYAARLESSSHLADTRPRRRRASATRPSRAFARVPLAELARPPPRRPPARARPSAPTIPREHPIAPVPFAEFGPEIEGGLFDADASVVVLEENEPVALLVLDDRPRARPRRHGPRPARWPRYRGRGLARFAKTDSLRRPARGSGSMHLATANDGTRTSRCGRSTRAWRLSRAPRVWTRLRPRDLRLRYGGGDAQLGAEVGRERLDDLRVELGAGAAGELPERLLVARAAAGTRAPRSSRRRRRRRR